MNANHHDPLAERARLIGRAALLLSVAPMLFYVWQAIGVPGMPHFGFGNPFAGADGGVVVRIADASPGPVRVDHPARINPRRAPAAALLRASRLIKPAVAPSPPASSQGALTPPPAVATPTRTTDAAAATGPAAATDAVRHAPVAPPAVDIPPVQVPTVPSGQVPAVQVPVVQVPAVQIPSGVPALTPVVVPTLP